MIELLYYNRHNTASSYLTRHDKALFKTAASAVVMLWCLLCTPCTSHKVDPCPEKQSEFSFRRYRTAPSRFEERTNRLRPLKHWSRGLRFEVTLRLTDSQSVSQYVLVTITLVGLGTRYYFLSKCYCGAPYYIRMQSVPHRKRITPLLQSPTC
jgi:hypothetical protein